MHTFNLQRSSSAVCDAQVEEGGEVKLSIIRRRRTSEDDGLTLRVETAPRHGQVRLITGSAGRELNSTSTQLTSLLDHRQGSHGVSLVYRHDGSSTTHDQFELALTDGMCDLVYSFSLTRLRRACYYYRHVWLDRLVVSALGTRTR